MHFVPFFLNKGTKKLNSPGFQECVDYLYYICTLLAVLSSSHPREGACVEVLGLM
jgi:hypothetical protein